MEGIVSFSSNTKADRYLTRMEKEDLKETRHGRMSKSERLREWSASILRIILLFGAPVILSMVMVIVLVAIYVVRPYALTRDFTRTTCEVSGHSIMNQTTASCSAGTDPFQPCIKLTVSFATGEKYQTGVIMENEQALVNCNLCSYTFGRHGLLHQYQDACESWKEYYDPSLCVEDFLMEYGVTGTVYPCFFNPHNPNQVVRDLLLDENLVIHAVSWPILLCLIYLLAWGFVCYDSKQGNIIDKFIKEEVAYKRKRQQMERFHATEWKKQRLGQTLGVRDEGSIGVINTFGRNPDMKRLSVSLPSLTDFSHTQTVVRQSNITESTDDLDNDIDNNNFDLRHLDLAVSQQNINDLSTSYPYMETPPLLTYENVTATFGTPMSDHLPVGLSRGTLPVLPNSPMSTFRRPTKYSIQSTDAIFNGHSSFSTADYHKTTPRRITTGTIQVGSNSFTPMTRGDIFYQQQSPTPIPDSGAISEDEIDGYYSVARNLPQEVTKEMTRMIDMYSANDESKV